MFLNNVSAEFEASFPVTMTPSKVSSLSTASLLRPLLHQLDGHRIWQRTFLF
jgi:hypothetical protein